MPEAETGGAIVGETRRGDSAGGNAGMAMNAMEERTETKGDATDAVVTDAMEEHTETKGDTTVAVATDAMEEHTETKGGTTAVGRVAPAESIVEATKADEEVATNRKGAVRVTNDMEGVTKIDADAGAADAVMRKIGIHSCEINSARSMVTKRRGVTFEIKHHLLSALHDPAPSHTALLIQQIILLTERFNDSL
ncbi:hypothetical protein CBR_g19300 [Chara braunii]|uniref:Uncharacterized protein n=1 Tax=Chara braunii TaxID=69332 RepID=A0A388KXP8_CHABU|nr:hypothetical protein CBR_g19300 [Chara braunii]|eukprot:GBG74788.1 hypothetical protein CBR_g19300 [Chara braunii]